MRHRLAPAAIAAATLTLALTVVGCSPQTPPAAPGETGPSSSPVAEGGEPSRAEPVAMTADPADGTTGVAVNDLITVRAVGGTLESVSVTGSGTDAKGRAFKDSIAGAANGDRTAWTASQRLEPGGDYTVTMLGTNAAGDKTTTTSRFSTEKLSLKQQVFASVYPLEGGEKFGVAMPLIVKFDLPIKDRATFEKHLKVASSPKQNGTWSWVSSTEVHYRPKDYWQPGTKVSLDADLNSLPAGGGIYGQESRRTSFTVGRSVVTNVDLKAKQAKVYLGGKLARTLPVSGGKPKFTTRSGTKVITEKLAATKMRSETVGIAEDSAEAYNLDVKYAIRITNSGEFIHAAPWNAGKFGRVNGSHGCVGMSTADARWLFAKVAIGDPVKMTGTGRSLEAGNGITDWNVSWDTFKKGSALR